MIRTYLAAAFLALLPVPGLAQSCDGYTQLEMSFCAKDRWAVADDELNRLWRMVKPLADGQGHGAQLLQEQRDWLRRRDATCEPELSGGGSAAPMTYWFCMEEMTAARNTALRARLP
ncbi:Uncharacterized conserved protein YecT, DUF1311 family [Palleronia marisminoris]|uniref:Lysozyme inhibitor LprI-like N-terminal domain-containing protein n=1 Tax=Palleronia marisminoris TaxID=315423 RepID=A0A1Y5SH97_9RHOB|nr:lysozyme inhibitor LprI family protein [Palleronia marisminoris]SFG81362.1 Uncharacterized conserved protein YecT, DUF1311 family [Palleronia marisminoris]SLN40096.1 hypothetical protein PAM7066_01704 [Palleronia marisminoris]